MFNVVAVVARRDCTLRRAMARLYKVESRRGTTVQSFWCSMLIVSKIIIYFISEVGIIPSIITYFPCM